MDNPDSLIHALNNLRGTTKFARFREIAPLIDKLIKERGVSRENIVETLLEHGLELNRTTLDNYLYRWRVEQRKHNANNGSEQNSQNTTTANRIKKSSVEGVPTKADLDSSATHEEKVSNDSPKPPQSPPERPKTAADLKKLREQPRIDFSEFRHSPETKDEDKS